MSFRRAWFGLLIILVALGIPSHAFPQSQIVDVTVHSPGLERNLLGDPADQPVSLYLPEAYNKEPQRRFAVMYFLHGYGDSSSPHAHAKSFQKVMDQLITSGSVQPMIIVLPNGVNKYRGTFYTNSTSTGNWDDFIARDVVGYVDRRFRTNATVAHRGIAGHSMGGYGALTLSFRHPEIFSSVYAMSPCCTDLVGDLGPSNPAWVRIGALQSPDEIPAALSGGQFFVAANAALSAALAPNAASRIFGDAPFFVKEKEVHTNPEAFSKIAAKMPANMVFPFLSNIMQLKGIFIEYGAQENFTHIVIGAQEVAQRLTQAGVSNTLEVFQGDHGNHSAQRITERLLPWMSKQIAQ